MASQEDVAAFILCLGLIWVWRQRRQHYRATCERLVAFYQCQAQELATITALVTRRTLLDSVRQTRPVWVRKRSHTFLDRIVAGRNEAQWKRKFYDWEANIPFSLYSILSRDLLIGNLVAKGTLEKPLDTVLAPNVQQKSDFGVGPH